MQVQSKHKIHYHEFTIHWDSMIHGHPVYEDIWTPIIDEILCVEQETHDAKDCLQLPL